MTNPELLQCPDRHYRGVVFEIRPFIADYPEQVILASIVQGWCPKCLASPDHLEYSGEPRCRGLHEMLRESFDSDIIWFTFGIVAGIKPFTEYFPRADIHELITPDLLHQVVKGIFKDHLVAWVEDYMKLKIRPQMQNVSWMILIISEPRAQSYVHLSHRPAYTRSINKLAHELNVPNLAELLGRFLWDQIYPDLDLNSEDIPAHRLPKYELD
ncbi:hypothetical protein QCA50_007125 [Cerrena zonata]|uniref:Uncharacterized protein n=1 Tax=Cerrena zonata TaxID=2478898 RepID=A0AAW0GHW4_9APHY